MINKVAKMNPWIMSVHTTARAPPKYMYRAMEIDTTVTPQK